MKNVIFKALGFLVVGLIFVSVGAWISEKIRKEANPDLTPTPRPVVVCSPEYLAYQTTRDRDGQVVKLISERTSSYAAGGQFVEPKVILTKSETDKSKLACGYLYIRAGTSTGALRSWENVYMNPQGFGGHLITDNIISKNDGPQWSEYIIGLDKIKYWTDRNRNESLSADWTHLLNVSPSVEFLISLNSENAGGFIDEISIAYKCWNPETGLENKDCKLKAERIE